TFTNSGTTRNSNGSQVSGVVRNFSRLSIETIGRRYTKTRELLGGTDYPRAARTSVAAMRTPATNGPLNVPDTLDSPPARRRWLTGISRTRSPLRAAFICISRFQP